MEVKLSLQYHLSAKIEGILHRTLAEVADRLVLAEMSPKTPTMVAKLL
jgi:hypothetical protein